MDPSRKSSRPGRHSGTTHRTLPRGSLNYSVPPAAFIASIVVGVWVARKAPGRPVLHGTLAGVVATLIYLGLSFGQPESAAYIAAHGLKILGGAAGGFVMSKRLKIAMSRTG